MNEPIRLSGKLYLLGINPKKGGIISSSYTAMDYILLGSLFLELYRHKNIRFEGKRIIIQEPTSKISLHHYLLEKMSKPKRSLKISRWMNKLYFSLKYIRKEIQQELVKKRIIRMQTRRFLFFRWQKPVIMNKQLLYHLVEDIENQVFRGTSDEEEIMLLSMIKPAGLLKRIFQNKEKRKRAQKQLNQLMVENQVSIAVADAISAAQAVAASIAVSAATSAAVTSS
ncbi:MAG TPA: GPP34 family phosphoprotein [Draconibacterium sp.]|nr:GPP34 family phosphoprotein [Draconibacterium sp.]